MRCGLVAEYDSAGALVVAIHVLRSRGYTKLDAYTPFPSSEVEGALHRRRSPVSLAAGFGGVLGAAGAYWIQWLAVAYLYPVDVGSHPPYMPLAFLVITLEMGFLVGGVTVFFATTLLSRLFRLWDPLFEVEGFESVTRDGFWLGVSAEDPMWNRREVEALVAGTGPSKVHGFGGLG